MGYKSSSSALNNTLPSNTSTSHNVRSPYFSKRTTRYLPVSPQWNASVAPLPTWLSLQAHTFMFWSVGALVAGLTSVVPMRTMESFTPEMCIMIPSHHLSDSCLKWRSTPVIMVKSAYYKYKQTRHPLIILEMSQDYNIIICLQYETGLSQH